MDERHLRLVIAVNRHGSLRRAAEALGLTQPTLSKTLARLEDELGVTLFDRSATGARATPIGLYIAERAARMIDDADRLKSEVKLLAVGELGEVRIGLCPALRPSFMPNFAEAIALTHPKLHLRLVSERRPHLMAGLQSGEFDLIFVTIGADFEDTDWVVTDILQDTLVAVASPGHPLAGRKRISSLEFARHPTISQPPESAFSTSKLMNLEGEGADTSSFYVVNDLASILRLVTLGVATTIGLEHQLRPVIDAGAIVPLDVDWSHQIRIVAAMTPSGAHSPVLRKIVTEAQDVAARL